jgi:hypothetical protein
MKSPFPGMDPYLERHWGDVHQRLCTYSCDQLQEQLGGNLIARLGERLVVESSLNTADAAEKEAFVEIIELKSSRQITVIEFLSPSNKLPGEGRERYQSRQNELSAAGVNVFEIDLLRAGQRAFMLPAVRFPPRLQATYAACAFRATRALRYELYPISLREPLRAMSVPLRSEDRDIALNLQPLIDLAYRNGRYDRTDYSQPCIPPLEGEDEQWAHTLLKNAGKRA